MSINFSDLNRGLVIELDGAPWMVMDYERHKMQQRAPVTRIKMKNLLSGAVVERTFQRYDTGFTVADIDNRPTQYLYTDGQYYYFLDQETFDQYELTTEILGESLGYLKENAQVEVVFYKGSPINVNMPTHVELEVTETAPTFRGDTAQGGNKPATLETGLRINHHPRHRSPGGHSHRSLQRACELTACQPTRSAKLLPKSRSYWKATPFWLTCGSKGKFPISASPRRATPTLT